MATNLMLQRQALTITQQIEELKNWHRQHQSKVNLEKSTKKDNFTEISPKIYEDKSLSEAVTVSSQYSNPPSQKNFDEFPIKVSNPNFKDILENNIPPNETGSSSNIPNIGTKPKFKFLKKGEGIARFRMGPQKIPKPRNKNTHIRSLNLSNNKGILTEKNLGSGNVPENKVNEYRDDILTLEPPDLRLQFKDWRTILNGGKAEDVTVKAVGSEDLEIFQPNSSIDSSVASIMEKLKVLGSRIQTREKEELRIFELVEQKVLDSSFCSTSSNIVRLMENAVMSTPEKKLPTFGSLGSNAQIDKVTKATESSNNQKVDVQEINEQIHTDPCIWIGPENIKIMNNQSVDESSIESSEPSLHVKFSDKIDYKSFLEYSQSSKNLDQKETNNKINFDENEEWKENSESSSSRCCSQCSTSYSSSEEDVEAFSPPERLSLGNNGQENIYCKESVFPDQKENSRKIISSKNRTEIDNLTTADPKKPIEFVAECETNHKLESILSAKIKELENEIENFRAENQKLKGLRENLEKERKQFQQEKNKLLKDVEEEKKKHATLLEEEKQKLAREKMIFEKYSKSLAKNPTKEERKEMLGLKEQLSEMREELNKKECRWAAAQARVRNQVKLLEEANKKLKDEVEVLRKQSKHLEFLSKKKKGKPFNNTKLIHAINNHLSKVSISDEEEKDYFNIKTNSYKIDQFEENPKLLNTVRIIRENKPKHSSPSVQNPYSELIVSLQTPDIQNEPIRKDVDVIHIQEQASCGSESNSSGKTTNTIQIKDIQNMENRTSGNKSLEENVINPIKETVNEDGSIQKIYPDGRKELFFKSGNIKKIDPLTGNEKTIYFNGDVEEVLRDGTVKYYFSDSRRWQTTFPDGLEVWDFPNGQVEKKHINGIIETIFPNDVRKMNYPNGSEEIFYADGTTLKIEADKRKVLSLPNGQKEIYTEECIRREYPDGTVKKLYPDGVTETIYSNGRVRIKDKHGNLVMDSGSLNDKKL